MSELNLFGLSTKKENSKVQVIPVPWEATTSYGSGTSNGPAAILQASPQLDLYDSYFENAFNSGYHMLEISNELAHSAEQAKIKAQRVIQALDTGKDPLQLDIHEVNEASEKMVEWVYNRTVSCLKSDQIPGILGGDHSTPLGAIKALSEHFKSDFGILHIDAHMDLRNAYQGFTHSHASIFYNVMNLPDAPSQLSQVGIRDYSVEEKEFQDSHNHSISCWLDETLHAEKFSGKSWASICEEIVQSLPYNVYVSFDIDGLSPDLCPNTGTPVPGGLRFEEAVYLLHEIHRQEKRLIGFDLSEVSPDPKGSNEWDGNVGARILFKLCGLAVSTQDFR